MKCLLKFVLLYLVLCCHCAWAVKADPHPIPGSNVAVAYLRPGSSEVYGQNVDIYYHPASTLKMLTALSAILYLGPQWRMRTSLQVKRSALNDQGALKAGQNGVLNSDVVIKFTGDPTFTSKKYQSLLKSLTKSGVHSIAGSVILDLSRFGGKSRGSGWSWDDLPVCFTAPAAPVIINRNCVFAQLQPHGAGVVATPVIPNSSPIEITSDAIGVAAKDYGGDCELEADLYMVNKYHITGCVPIQKQNKPWPLSLSVSDPQMWGVDWTAKLLRAAGLGYKEIKVTRRPLPDFVEFSYIESAPLREIVKYMLQRSNNLYADAVAKNVAAEYFRLPATYYRVSTAIRSILRKYANINLGNAYIVDGSGLSPHNLITPRQMLDLLQYIAVNDAQLKFTELMPKAGVSGTLRWRGSTREPPLKENVIAKTGTLQNVSNLAGFMTTRSGTLVPFVMFSNSLSYSQKVRDQVKYHRIASPHYGYERYVLEQIYNEKIMGTDF